MASAVEMLNGEKTKFPWCARALPNKSSANALSLLARPFSSSLAAAFASGVGATVVLSGAGGGVEPAPVEDAVGAGGLHAAEARERARIGRECRVGDLMVPFYDA
jgi:hypothetical protein